jgi:putative ABC transport system permease protein
MARRDAWRHKGRSVLVLVMIALPVMGVTAADVVIATVDVSGAESLERRLGAADARIEVRPAQIQVAQDFDPDEGNSWSGRRGDSLATLADVERVLGRDVRAIEPRVSTVRYRTDKGTATIELRELALADPLAEGLFELTEGSLPTATDEVLVNAAAAGRGPGLGEHLELKDGTALTVVGIAEDASYIGYETAFGLPGSFGLGGRDRAHTWLVDAGGAVTWDEVRALNEIGALVLSRAVMEDPPPRSELDPEIASWSDGPVDEATIAVVLLIVVMALLEVVLLAGPAFAVSARRLSRTIALMAATGGTPRQARRVVLASGVVLGTLAAGIGVLLGIGVARAALPLVQRFDDSRFGPFDVPWAHLAGVAAFGLLSAVLAAVVPAWIASRQDVVAVLAGRRGDRAPSLRNPLLGVLLLGAGVAGAAYGAVSRQNGEYFIAASAILSVLGMILLVPVVVVGLARLCRRLPLAARYSVRDAARHRTRTVPAVAAVAATVAGVVALGISVASDAAENEHTYYAQLPVGTAAVTHYGRRAADWDGYADLVRRELPGASVEQVAGIREEHGRRTYTYTELRIPGDRVPPSSGWSSAFGTGLLVSDAGVPPSLGDIDVDEAELRRVLAAGGMLVFADHAVAADEVRVDVDRRVEGSPPERERTRLPAVYVNLGARAMNLPQGVLSSGAAQRLGLESTTRALHVSGVPIPRAVAKDLDEALSASSRGTGLFVERGYQADGETTIILLVLGVLGGVLMLGGTLTATFLALSDARPDLATLAAVGAAPRTRRAVAASYAVVVGLVGSVLGAVVGFVPGIAVTYPLTGQGWAHDIDPTLPSHYLDVPWLLIGTLVLGLPLLTAAIVGLTARSRLPLVARLD